MENVYKGVDAEFERCIDFLSSMIELYGAEVLQEVENIENSNNDESVA